MENKIVLKYVKIKQKIHTNYNFPLEDKLEFF